MSRRFRQLESIDQSLSKRPRSLSENSSTSEEESLSVSSKNKDISEQVCNPFLKFKACFPRIT